MQEENLSGKESLDLITRMINKARNSRHNTGVSAILWGTVIAVCSLVKLAELQFDFRLPFDIYLLTLVAVVPQVIISIREKRSRKVTSYDDIYMDNVWLAFGICIFLLILVSNFMFAGYENMKEEYAAVTGGKAFGFRLYEYNASLFLMLYGFPTFVTGAACRFRPMVTGGIVCWASCIAALFTPIKADLLLLAFAAVTAWLIPGIILERDYRKAKKGLAEADV